MAGRGEQAKRDGEREREGEENHKGIQGDDRNDTPMRDGERWRLEDEEEEMRRVSA